MAQTGAALLLERLRIAKALPGEDRGFSELDEMIYGGLDAMTLAFDELADQIISGMGFSPDDPIVGAGISGFYLMLRTVDGAVVSQCAVASGGAMLDCMRCVLLGNGGEVEVELFNLVEPGE